MSRLDWLGGLGAEIDALDKAEDKIVVFLGNMLPPVLLRE